MSTDTDLDVEGIDERLARSTLEADDARRSARLLYRVAVACRVVVWVVAGLGLVAAVSAGILVDVRVALLGVLGLAVWLPFALLGIEVAATVARHTSARWARLDA